MRLFELTQIDEVTSFQERKLEETDWKHPREVSRWLKSKGFKSAGGGSFAQAFIHPNYKRIVKISKRQDVCWLRFAYWTLKMTSNPSVPYIDWVRVFGDDDKFFIAVIEKLAPFNSRAIKNTVDIPGLAYLYLQEGWFDGDRTIENRLVDEGIIDLDDVTYEEGWHKSIRRQLRAYLKTVKTGKRFINTLKAIKKFEKAPCVSDMHEGNLMYRPKYKRLVVIDPLADLSEIGFSF